MHHLAEAPNWTPSRRFVAAIAGAIAAMVWVQAAAALLRALGPAGAPPVAVPLTLLAALSAGLGAALLPRRRALLAAAALGGAGAVAIALAVPGSWAGVSALPLVAAAATAGARWLGARLPAAVDLALSRRRVLAVVWALASLASAVQVGRLSAFMSDRNLDFVVANRNPFWYRHECLPAYLHAAELAGRGEPDLYAARHYPGLDPSAQPVTGIANMAVEDPYQYPPQFLLLPMAALRLTHDAALLRVVWYALQASLFVGAFAALALWAGGRAGRGALWLLPLALSAFPVIFNFQFGQFHLAAISLAVLAMLAFERRQRAVGGLLLATAILAKIFPAVLTALLLGRGRFRELAWTAAWGVAITAVAVALLGPAPFHAFWSDHLPRMTSGAAFAFDEAWPELAGWVLADNQGIFGLVRKLGGTKASAALAGSVFAAGVFVLAGWLGRRLRGDACAPRAMVWLGLLGLASMSSAGAWGDYVPTTAIWLVALLAERAGGGLKWALPIGVVAAFQYFLFGTLPIGEWGPPAVMLPLATTGLLLLGALFGGAVALALARESQRVAASGRPARDAAPEFEPAPLPAPEEA